VVPTVNSATVTPHTEAFQAVVWHLMVSHPAVKLQETKWESAAKETNPAARAVFLDRDGVLNRSIVRNGKPHPPTSLAELEIMPGASDALHHLKANGYKLLVVTNQPDIARGTTSSKMVDEINQRIASALPVDEICVCAHIDEDHCECRKPKPGMLQELARRHNVDLASSFMIGDRWRDVEAGQNAGCRAILIDDGYEEREPARPPDARVRSLPEAVDWILERTATGARR
jgi:D-glycero-D-manno-heptose 1,7-bisphosphate phosphatase